MSAADVDLNLLRVLDALLTEGSVVGAAAELHLSPPAVSRSLGRLRRALDDPLLVRSGRGLVPTPRAEAIREEVRAALDAATAALTPAAQTFDPAQLTRRFTITVDDATLAGFGMTLVERIKNSAPGVDLSFLPDTNEADLLKLGRVDLDLGAAHGFADETVTEVLGTVKFLAAVRVNHPLTQQRLSLRRYADAHHIVVSTKGQHLGPVDEVLEAKGLRRQHITVAPSFLSAALMVTESDAVGLLPDATVASLQSRMPLLGLPLPFPTPTVAVAQSWHPRFQADPAHRWLRATVREIAAARLSDVLPA